MSVREKLPIEAVVEASTSRIEGIAATANDTPWLYALRKGVVPIVRVTDADLFVLNYRFDGLGAYHDIVSIVRLCKF